MRRRPFDMRHAVECVKHSQLCEMGEATAVPYGSQNAKERIGWGSHNGLVPIGSMYAIYGNICHQYTPNVSIYHIYHTWILWGIDYQNLHEAQ